MSTSLAPDRLAEAALIESEWNVMSYKDRAAWWMSAKWYGYQSLESYRSGEVAKPNESCRYGEPGFFIATRVPYYEAQAAVVEVVAAAATAAAAEAAEAAEAATTSPTESVIETVAEPGTDEAAAAAPAPALAPALAQPAPAPIQPNTNAPNKKKKKNKRGGSIGAGKTIEISLGR